MKKYKNLKLENQLCFAVYAATNSITRVYRESLAKSGLTYTQYLIMLALWEEDKVNVKSIAEKLKLDSASLTPALKRMEQKGYIERYANHNVDKRNLCIVLTDTGQELQKEISLVQKNVHSMIGLNDDLAAQLRKNLDRLVKNLE